MAELSRFYFDARVKGREFVQGIPMFAVHVGENTDLGWSSTPIENYPQWKSLMWRVDRTVGLYLAMPRMFANQHFPKQKHYDEVVINAFTPKGSRIEDFGSGQPVVLKFTNVQVVDAKPILQWKGLPIPPQVQKNFLEKKIGRETYIPMAVRLAAEEADAIN